MAVLQSVTQLSDSETELGRSNENSKDTSTNEPKKVKKETKQAKKETKPDAKKETKPSAKKETKPNAKKVAKKKPAASNAEPEKPENPVIPEVVTRETAGGLCCNATEEDGYRLRPYKQTKAMAIQRTTGDKKQVLQAGFPKASAWFLLHEKKTFLALFPNNPSPKPFSRSRPKEPHSSKTQRWLPRC